MVVLVSRKISREVGEHGAGDGRSVIASPTMPSHPKAAAEVSD